MKSLWRRLQRGTLYYLIRLFRLKGHDRRLARGFASGLIVNFIPTFGFGMFISPVLAKCLAGNVTAGFIGGVIFNWSWPLLFALNVTVGEFLFQGNLIVVQRESFFGMGKSFLAGMVINCVVFGVGIYYLMMWMFRRWRDHIIGFSRRWYLRLANERPV